MPAGLTATLCCVQNQTCLKPTLTTVLESQVASAKDIREVCSALGFFTMTKSLRRAPTTAY